MSVSILTRRKSTQRIGVLELDATLSERHNFRNDVTNYPVEEGFDISDHIRQEPEEINISGFITNTPINLDRAGEVLYREDYSNNIQLAFNELLSISGRRVVDAEQGTTIQTKDAELVDVVTILQVYTSMVVTDLQFPVRRDGGNSQRFRITLKKLNRVRSDITVVQNISDLGGKAANAKEQGAKKEKVGKKDTKKEEAQSESFLDKVGDWFNSVLGKDTGRQSGSSGGF